MQVDKWAREQTPPVEKHEIDAAYAESCDRWIDAANEPDAHLYALHVARREGLYAAAMRAGDINLAHRILIDQARLQRQYREAKREEATAATAEDIAERIRERIRQRGKPTLTPVPASR